MSTRCNTEKETKLQTEWSLSISFRKFTICLSENTLPLTNCSSVMNLTNEGTSGLFGGFFCLFSSQFLCNLVTWKESAICTLLHTLTHRYPRLASLCDWQGTAQSILFYGSQQWNALALAGIKLTISRQYDEHSCCATQKVWFSLFQMFTVLQETLTQTMTAVYSSQISIIYTIYE